MMTVLDCLTAMHDWRLVALAALVCTLASVTSVELLSHARRAGAGLKLGWIAVAGAAGGSGIWATHFVAMLAYDPGVASGYDIGLTVLSLVLAVGLTSAGLGVAVSTRLPGAAMLGGGGVGVGIAAMHYTGMAAYEVAGRLAWSPSLVVSSIVIGAALGALSLPLALDEGGLRRRLRGAGALLLAICGHHFTAMGAVTIVPDPTVALSTTAVETGWLAIAVAMASLVLLLLAGAALALDIRDRQRAALEGERLRSLANAAVEGLVVCRGDVIVSANDSFSRLVAVPVEALVGLNLSNFVDPQDLRAAEAGGPDRPVEAELAPAEGSILPVEMIMRSVAFGGEPHQALAVRDLRARLRAERQIQHLAHHDPLTGLYNRTYFNRRLDEEIPLAADRGVKLAVLCLDLDRFKEVNDLFGHAAGDLMLSEVGRIVNEALGENEVLARLGGDEFAVLGRVETASAAGALAERILEALRRESGDRNGPLIATSIGIALYPDDALDRASLLSDADTALYRAKSEGRGTYRFFESRMGAEVRDRRLVEHDLRHAIARGEMSLVYQPQTEVGTGRVVGFEALLRWRHPERGAVSPMAFIPIAEETGLILPIGDWVLREACREAAAWPNPLTIAVNVSAVQVHSPHFSQIVHEILFETGLAPGRLEIEITETALVRDANRALATLRQIKALGVRVAMDDFGTGYSSLSNLRAFPFDKIKIDRSFVSAVDTNEQTAAIVRSVLGLGRGLGLPVLAEGVETDAELRFLRAENCQEAQGYLMGRPSSIATFRDHTHGEPLARADAA